MYSCGVMPNCWVHRRKGGLENLHQGLRVVRSVHRRKGGLEIKTSRRLILIGVHRRKGGLEISGRG